MDKRKLVAAVAKKTDYAKWEINKILEPLLETIIDALENGDEVALNNFGKFTLKHQKGKETIHPKTQQRIKVPPKVSVVFNATRMFKPTDETMKKFAKQKGLE